MRIADGTSPRTAPARGPGSDGPGTVIGPDVPRPVARRPADDGSTAAVVPASRLLVGGASPPHPRRLSVHGGTHHRPFSQAEDIRVPARRRPLADQRGAARRLRVRRWLPPRPAGFLRPETDRAQTRRPGGGDRGGGRGLDVTGLHLVGPLAGGRRAAAPAGRADRSPGGPPASVVSGRGDAAADVEHRSPGPLRRRPVSPPRGFRRRRPESGQDPSLSAPPPASGAVAQGSRPHIPEPRRVRRAA